MIGNRLPLTRQLLLLFFALIVLVGATVLWALRTTDRALAARATSEAAMIAHLLQARIEGSLTPEQLQRQVAILAANRGVVEMMVLGGEPLRVLASSRRAWRGLEATALPDRHLAEHLTRVAESGASHFAPQGEAIHVVRPLLLYDPKGVAVHRRTILYVSLDASEARQARATLQRLLVVLVLAIVGLGTGLLWQLHHRFLQPIDALIGAIRRRVSGLSSGRVPIPEQPELGHLAAEFNRLLDVEERSHEQIRRQMEAQEALIALSEAAPSLSERELLQRGLDLAERLTDSRIGYLHFVNADQRSIELAVWSTATYGQCQSVYDSHYPIDRAGVWADTFRQRRPVIHNDYPSVENRRGLPEGHVELKRHLGVPVLDGNEVRMLVGVGNRGSDYDESHVEIVQNIANSLWLILSRQRSNAALKQSEALFRGFFEANLVGMAVTLPDKSWNYINQALCDMLGYEREELSRMTWAEVTHPEDLAADVREFERLLAGEADHYTMEKRFLRKDGGIVHAIISVGCVRDAEGKVSHFLASIADTSALHAAEAELRQRLKELAESHAEQQRLQAQLVQSEKMAAIGQLAAGIAHEINTPTGYVLSNLGTLQREITALLTLIDTYETECAAHPPSPEVAEQIRLARQQADIDFVRNDLGVLMAETMDGLNRIRSIVQDLKTFSHPGNTTWQWADLNENINSTLNITWNEIKHKAEVVKEFGELPKVWCQPSQINQVLMNLITNAVQAIEPPGTLYLRTRLEGDWVCLEVEDTGSGIPPEVMPHLFDPFFTTKAPGQGTGLGLSIAWRIVQEHKGRIEVDSTPGKGTRFCVWLPVDLRRLEATP